MKEDIPATLLPLRNSPLTFMTAGKCLTLTKSTFCLPWSFASMPVKWSVNQIWSCTVNSKCQFEGLLTYSAKDQAWNVGLISWRLNTDFMAGRLAVFIVISSFDVEQNFINILNVWFTFKSMIYRRLTLVLMFASKYVISISSSSELYKFLQVFKFRIIQIHTVVCVALKSDDTVKHVKNKTSKREQEHHKQNLYGNVVWKNMKYFDW